MRKIFFFVLCVLINLTGLWSVQAAGVKFNWIYNNNFDLVLSQAEGGPAPSAGRADCGDYLATILSQSWNNLGPALTEKLRQITTVPYPRTEMDGTVVSVALPGPGLGPQDRSLNMISAPFLIVVPKPWQTLEDAKKNYPAEEKYFVTHIFYGILHRFRALHTGGKIDDYTEKKYGKEVSARFKDRDPNFWHEILFQLPTLALAKAVLIETGYKDLWDSIFIPKAKIPGPFPTALELLERDGYEQFIQVLNPNYKGSEGK